MKLVFKYLRPYKWQLIVGPIFKFTEAVLELLIPVLVAKMVNYGVLAGRTDLVWRYGLTSLGLAIIGFLCAVVCQYTASLAAQGFGTDLRNDLLAKILKLKPEDVDRLGVSSLTNRMTTDVQVLQWAVAMFIRLVIRAPFLSIGSLVMAFLLNWRLATTFIVALVSFALALYLVMSRSLPLYREKQDLTDKLVLRMLELLSGIRVIRALNQDQMKANQYDALNDEISRVSRRLDRLSSLLNPLTGLILNFAAVGVLYLAQAELQLGRTDAGQLIAFINYLGMMVLALSVVANLVVLYTRAYAAGLRVNQVLALEERPVGGASPEGKTLPEGKLSIAFQKVCFTYPQSSEPLFAGLDFNLPAGQSLGVIGPTGAGKSTVAYLLERLYRPDRGKILLGGVDLNALSEQDLLTRVHVVRQKSSLFQASIRENLCFGQENLTDEEIWRALSVAQAADFCRKMEGGLDSPLTAGGLNLSGGQRQRLALARGLLRRPQVLIMDDSSSALDYATAGKINKDLARFYPEMTKVVISQRVAAIQQLDLVLLLDNGRQVAFASPDELAATCPLYQEIMASQAQLAR